MPESLLETLPLPQRLALAYAPARARTAALHLLAFDARLGQALRAASEPIMAQMRLAWWRDQLNREPSTREASDALLLGLARFDAQRDRLIALVDGWEALLAEDFGEEAARTFASARAQSWLALARHLGVEGRTEAILLAGQRWALADLAAGLSDPDERAAVSALARGDNAYVKLPRLLRPLAVLDGLARRSLAKGGAPLLDGPLGGLAAMRIGLLGR